MLISHFTFNFLACFRNFIGLSYVVAIILGGYYCLIGDITLGKFITFASYIGTLFWPMFIVGDIVTVFLKPVLH